MIRPYWVLVPLAGCLFVCAGWKVQELKPIVNPAIRDETLDVGENSSTVSLLGQFRTTASSWLWLRADSYLHNGVEMRPMSEEEQKQGIAVDNAKDDGNEKLHAENEITAVPPRERDFRGVFGDIERQVASYKDMHGHGHNDPRVALPLYRLMTWIDPQFVQGWTMGAMILARDRSTDGLNRSCQFLREGWAANPESVDIPSQIGYTIASRHGDLSEAIRYLESARQLGYPRRRSLFDQEADGLRTAYRFLALCYRDTDRYDLERQLLTEGIKVFPDYPLMPKLLAQEEALAAKS
ncbi:MAG: tetratricopeptide repeat protein [Fimbriimonadales bacterium]